jgi:hypothetical protein
MIILVLYVEVKECSRNYKMGQFLVKDFVLKMCFDEPEFLYKVDHKDA